MTDDERTLRNTRLMARYRQAWEDNDIDALFACYHPDFTIHYFGNSPVAGAHVGRDAFMQVLAETYRRSKRRLIEVVDVVAGPHRAMVLVRERFSRDGKTAEVDRCMVYSFADEALRECWVY